MAETRVPEEAQRVWVTSDFHLHHRRILEYEPSRPKNFEQVLADNWNEVVRPEDVVYNLGDVMLCGGWRKKHAAEILRELPGKKILVRGNHDRSYSDKFFMEDCGFIEIYPLCVIVGDLLLSHYPMIEDPHHNYRYSEQCSQLYEVFKAQGCRLNIHGHLHSKESPDPRCRNVSVEKTGFRPVLLESF